MNGKQICRQVNNHCFQTKLSRETIQMSLTRYLEQFSEILNFLYSISYPHNKSLIMYLKSQLILTITSQVESALKNYHGSLERVVNRECIEIYNQDEFQMLKTAYRQRLLILQVTMIWMRCFTICYCITLYCFRYFNKSNMDLLTLSIQDFNACQALHQDELQKLERYI